MARVFRLLEHPAVERQPGELAVQVAARLGHQLRIEPELIGVRRRLAGLGRRGEEHLGDGGGGFGRFHGAAR